MSTGNITAGLSGRYAEALFEVARSGPDFDAIGASLLSLHTALGSTPDLMQLIRSPLVARAEQERAILAVADDLRLHRQVRAFLGVLARARRLNVLPQVLRDYRALAARARGETTAEVTSARPLSAEQTERLRDVLKAKLRREVALEARVDPAILGGLIVKIGSRVVDSSIRTKLAAVGAAMKG